MSLELSGLTHPSHGRILDIIRAAGAISRVEIADRSGMTGASVTNIVRSLLDMDLVREIGQAESTGGKRRTLLAIAPESRYAVGVHARPESTTYTVSDMAGRSVGRRVLSGLPPEDASERLRCDVTDLLDDLAIPRTSVLGIGVAAGQSLRADLEAADPTVRAGERLAGAPLVVDREAVAAAVGEFWQGTAAQPTSFSTLSMGDEFGAGFINAGTAWRGATASAGEIGHIPVQGDGIPCACGRSGCLQAVASPAAVVQAAEAEGVLTSSTGSSVADRFDDLARRAVLHEARPRELIVASAQRLAAVAVTVADVTDVEMFILTGSGFAVAGAIYARHIRQALAQDRPTQQVAVELAHNPRDASAIGASALVLQRALTPR